MHAPSSTRTRRRAPGLGLALVAALALLALLVAPALADRVVRDEVKENRGLRENGRIDIVRATSGRANGRLEHTVTMRRQVKPKRGRERPGILINTRGGRSTNPEYLVFGSRVLRLKRGGEAIPIGAASLSAKGRTWTYRFRPKAIPNLKRYGWAAVTDKGDVGDIAPNDRYAKARAGR